MVVAQFSVMQNSAAKRKVLRVVVKFDWRPHRGAGSKHLIFHHFFATIGQEQDSNKMISYIVQLVFFQFHIDMKNIFL